MIYELGTVRPKINADNVFIAPTAVVIGNCELGERSSIWFQTVLRGDNDPIKVGARSNVQDGSVLHTDTGAPLTIGSGVTIGHKAMLHGCEIGDDTLIGMGATILNRARIGTHCLVGANSLVTEGKIFPDGVLIVGSPASVKRDLTPEEIELIKMSANHYVENAKRYMVELKAI